MLEQIEERERVMIEEMKKIEQKLLKYKILVQFEDFSNLQKLFVGPDDLYYNKHYIRYEQLAINYLKRVIQFSNQKPHYPQTQLFMPPQKYTYFQFQLNKIVDTPYYPFYRSLKEINCVTLISKLQQKVKSEQIEGDNQQQLLNTYQGLVKNKTLVSHQCIGCNSFYNQFFPIERLLRKNDYQVEFFYNKTQQMRQHALKRWKTGEVEQVYKNSGNGVNLERLQRSNKLIKSIVNILNSYGGFIVIGCKRVVQFVSIKGAFNYNQLVNNLIDINLVIGEKVDQNLMGKMKKGIAKLIQRIFPPVNVEYDNIKIQFLPIKPSLFELGLNISSLELSKQQIEERKLHLIVIRIDPTEIEYRFQPREEQEQLEGSKESQDSEGYKKAKQATEALEIPSEISDKKIRVRQYIQRMRQKMGEEDYMYEQLLLGGMKQSYFRNHKCSPIQYEQ